MYHRYNDLGTLTSNPHAGNRGSTSIGDLVRERREGVPSTQGTFASDEQLATLRDRLSGQPTQPAGSQAAAGKGGIADLVRGVREDRTWTETPREPGAPMVNRQAAGTFSPSRRYTNDVSQNVNTTQMPQAQTRKNIPDAFRSRPVSEVGKAAEDLGEAAL
jgi:hypothetical protein